ncbi:MAG: HPP family protein [Gemmatimonadota bacterium]
MMKVRDVMTTDLVTATPSDSVREAAEAMAHDHVSGLPVVEAGRAVGVVSATDVLAFAADTAGMELERTEAPGADRVPAGAQWDEGAGLPEGYFGEEEWDDEEAYLEAWLPADDRPEWNVLEDTTVAELMTRAVHSISADAGVEEAAREMLETGVRRLLVVEDDRLAGVVSSTDVMEAVAEHGIGG